MWRSPRAALSVGRHFHLQLSSGLCQSYTLVRYRPIKYYGDTENARPDIARLDNSAPYRKGGHREACFIVRVEAQYKLIFAAGSII